MGSNHLYTIRVKKSTRFDLPYHDMLTLREGEEIIQDLKKEPPCLFIIQEASLSKSGLQTPFSAKGMRKVESFLKDFIPKNYIYLDSAETYGKNHLIFKKI